MSHATELCPLRGRLRSKHGGKLHADALVQQDGVENACRAVESSRNQYSAETSDYPACLGMKFYKQKGGKPMKTAP